MSPRSQLSAAMREVAVGAFRGVGPPVFRGEQRTSELEPSISRGDSETSKYRSTMRKTFIISALALLAVPVAGLAAATPQAWYRLNEAATRRGKGML
jgi:hypothetical protein